LRIPWDGEFTLKHAKQDNVNAKILVRLAELEALIRAQPGHRSRSSTPAGPDGAIMLVEFAEAHAVTIGILRGLAERDPTLATVIERPYAEHKKHKWMIVPAQMAPMLAALEKHGTPYKPCAHRPHEAECAQGAEAS
jgi:hypothetical protein